MFRLVTEWVGFVKTQLSCILHYYAYPVTVLWLYSFDVKLTLKMALGCRNM